MAAAKSKGPKIANPAKSGGKSRATQPKPTPAPAPKVKKSNKKSPVKKADKNPATKKATKATAKEGSSSTAKRSSIATLFEDDEELSLPRLLKKRKPMPIPTPEPELEGSVIDKVSSPLSSPSPSPPRKARTPEIEEEAGDVENEVLSEAEDHEDASKADEDIEDRGGDNTQPEDEDEEAQIEDQDQNNAEGEEDEDEDDLDRFQDPEATAYALAAALGFTTEAEKVAYARYLKPFYKIAHITPRAINPFLSIGSTLETAMRLDPYQPYVQQSAEAEMEELNEASFTHTMQFYRDFVGFCPHILKVMHASMDDPGLFGALCKYMDNLASAARRVDCNRIRTMIILYIPNLPKNVTLRKEDRGWLNEHTARLLCPQSKIKDFDEDWKVWTQKVKQGHIRITEFDFPSFLWDQSVVDPDDITVGLLRGPVLLSCFRVVFTGPRTGDSEEPGMKPGKPCFMQSYNMQTVLAQMIAHIAVLVRFALNRQRSWHNHDNDFNSKEFFNAIVSLFCSGQEGGTAWSVETLEWWNLQILNEKPREFRKPSEDSEFAMIQGMFAARNGPAGPAS